MFTRTAKQILSPLAESVSALIVIISDSEANGTPTPDLSQLSKAVETQLGNMLRIAKEIGGQPGADAELRAAMPGACDEVTNASSLLVSATDELARNPVSPAGRARLLDAVKGILSGTTLMLAALDGSEVRKILAASRVFCGHLSRLCGGVPAAAAAAAVMSHTAPATAPGSAAAAATANAAPPPPKIYIQWVTQASQTLVVLAQLATKRVAEILSDAMQLELQAQIRVLTKESPLLISACKMVLTAPEAEEPVYAMQGICERLRAASARIDEIVQWRGDGVGDEVRAVLR
ncbi:hypothetical protein HK105_201754 [Polyrhizophydium stewartii]|uniref:Vinculin-binding site-containing domain-containing protein n=1 Tax=Polyrhizophydium stewartii TaxID=2732419 RepID=A0ABR4NHB2_9FUNG